MTLKRMLIDLTGQLDKTQRLLQQLLACARSGTRSEQLTVDQFLLFAQELGAEIRPNDTNDKDDDRQDPPVSAGGAKSNSGGGNRWPRPP